jgi:hypothetical protein
MARIPRAGRWGSLNGLLTENQGDRTARPDPFPERWSVREPTYGGSRVSPVVSG